MTVNVKFALKFVHFDDLNRKFIAHCNNLLIIVVIIHKFGIFAASPVLQSVNTC